MPTSTEVVVIEDDFTGPDAHGWYGGVLFSTDTEAVRVVKDGNGLCMYTTLEGVNFLGWVSPERYVTLVDGTVYDTRFTVSATSTAPDTIPLCLVTYDNYNSATRKGNNYSGQFWDLDVAGGANGIGRPQGITEIRMFVTPNAALLPQWTASFTPNTDMDNDFRLFIHQLDIDGTGVTSEQRHGYICLSQVHITARSLDHLLAGKQLTYDNPLTPDYYYIETFDQRGDGGAVTAEFVDGKAIYRLTPSHETPHGEPVITSRRTLGPTDPAAHSPSDPINRRLLFPIPWQSDQLLVSLVRVETLDNENDPPDILILTMDVGSNEWGQTNGSTRGGGNELDRAASPRFAGGQYVGFYYTHNQSAITAEQILRGQFDATNRSDIVGYGAGGISVTDFSVWRLNLP